MFVVQIFQMLVRMLHLIAIYCSEEIILVRSSEDCRKVYDNSFGSFSIPTLILKVLFNGRSGSDSICTGKQICRAFWNLTLSIWQNMWSLGKQIICHIFFLSKQLHYFYHLNELYLLNKMSFLSGRTACWGFFFSYSDFFLPSKAGVTDVTAMFVNFNRRSAVTQATTYIKQIVINTLPC